MVPTLDDMKSKYEVKPKKAKVEKSENSAENVATEDGENGRTISAENSDKLQEVRGGWNCHDIKRIDVLYVSACAVLKCKDLRKTKYFLFKKLET